MLDICRFFYLFGVSTISTLLVRILFRAVIDDEVCVH